MNPMMKLEIPNCPVCGEQALGGLEFIEAISVLRFTEADVATYAGETRELEQYSLCRGPHQLELVCNQNHRWPSYVLHQ